MGLTAIAFYALAAVAVGAALAVISARNPVHSVLFLILTFFSTAGLFVLLGAEFLAMLLVVVYVGAVAVLFLFVVMMLDVNFAELKQGFLSYMPLGALIGLALLAELVLVTSATHGQGHSALAPPVEGTNALAIGRVLYTDYLVLFQLSGLVLFVAMIGAVVLTLRKRTGVKRQSVSRQVGRTRKQAVELKDVKSGQGLS
ncbi:MAG: NADH-quinone oxidoreductase subunit J [Alphaproteobacteria bacterium]|nr:NADH-quinone oxidoreductase subunit J [Alphaproteobacteria bacterium]